MPLTIPNESAAPADAAQSTLYETDIKALVAGIGGDGVITGCAVTAQGTPNTTVAVATGVIKVGTTYAVVVAANVSMPAADATNPRWVLVSASNTGTLTATGGTAAAAPLLPAIPANSVALAAVWWPANDTTVGTAQITPKDVVVDSDPPDMRLKRSGATYYDIPGVGIEGWRTIGLDGSRIYYYPMSVRGRSITVTSLGFRVATAAGSGNTARVAIYRANVDGQPLSLVVGATGITINTTGARLTSVSATLAPGNYLLALWLTAGIDVGQRFAYGPASGALSDGLDEFDFIRRVSVFRDAAANLTWPDPGVFWDAADTGNQGFEAVLFVGN